MFSVNQVKIKEGDWISGTTREDEKIIGYVQSISDGGGVVKVRVTQSDNEEITGSTVEIVTAKARKMADYEPAEPEDIRSLLELSLMTRDKLWFDSLSAMLADSPSRAISNIHSKNEIENNKGVDSNGYRTNKRFRV